MPTIFLESKDNPKIKHLRGLIEQNNYRKNRDKRYLKVHICVWRGYMKIKINSIFTTEHALSHPDYERILAKYTGVVFVIGESLYKDLSTLGTSLACLAIVDVPSSSQALDFKADTLILENVQDPGNVGTLLRSAAAAGIEQIICTKGSASLWSPRVLRAGMGAHFSLHTFENIELEDVLAQFQIPVYVTSSHHAESLYSKICVRLASGF